MALQFPWLRRVTCQVGVYDLLLERFGEIGGNNSGFHALNLAVQFGCKKIILLGFDMSLAGGSHWHGRHPAGLNNPSQAAVDKWRRDLDAQKPVLDRIGVQVIIGTPGSALQAFPKMTWREALEA